MGYIKCYIRTCVQCLDRLVYSLIGTEHTAVDGDSWISGTLACKLTMYTVQAYKEL